MTRYISKFGEQRMTQMLPYMKQVGAKEGIAFDYGGKVAHTGESHRIAEWAYEKGGAAMQEQVMEEMFKDYFERQQNIGSADVLAKAATRAGVSTEEEAKAMLASDQYKAQVDREIKTYMTKYRVSGVPFFIIDGKYGVSGAQEPEAFMEIFEELVGEQ